MVLWGSRTDLWSCEVVVTDEVLPGEVELAHADPPETYLTFDEYDGGTWGVVQGAAYSEWVYGEGPYGGVELEWDDPDRR